MDRRSFLSTGCRACAALATLPLIATLDSCSSAKAIGATVANNVLRIPLTALGSGSTTLIDTKDLADPILIVREGTDAYHALVLRCPHKGGPVKDSGAELKCSWHGSTFDLNGTVTKGPSKEGLRKLPAEVAGTSLQVPLG